MSPLDRTIRLTLTLALGALSTYALLEQLWGVLVPAVLLTFFAGLAASGMTWGKAKAGPVQLEAAFSEKTSTTETSEAPATQAPPPARELPPGQGRELPPPRPPRSGQG